MNAAGQASGLLTKQLPAAEIVAEMVADAADLLGGLGKRIRTG